MQAIFYDKTKVEKAVSVQVITLADAPKRFIDIDKGAAKKFVLGPHKMVPVFKKKIVNYP